LVILPTGDRVLDVALLALFGPSAEHDSEAVAIFAKIDPITRTEIDPVLEYAASHALNLREVSQGKPGQSRCYLGRCLWVETLEPQAIWVSTPIVDVFANIDDAL
jgi:hypothetical protein